MFPKRDKLTSDALLLIGKKEPEKEKVVESDDLDQWAEDVVVALGINPKQVKMSALKAALCGFIDIYMAEKPSEYDDEPGDEEHFDEE